MDKIKYFDFFIYSLLEFLNPNYLINKPNFNKLKLLKLLFFVTVFKNKEKGDLLDIFDNFHAMPFGPVESDVYNQLSNLPHFTFENNRVNIKKDARFKYELNEDNKNRIRAAIKELFLIHPKLATMSSFDLVELSHKSECWIISFSYARKKGKYSASIPNSLIQSTNIVFEK